MLLEEVAYAVCTCLNNQGITAVLTGGSAATVYAPNAYQSRDLDFVIEFATGAASGAEVLNELGFTNFQSTYRSALTPFTLDFPAGPLAVGDELITTWNTVTNENLILNIITQTDSVRDRLAWFYFANDYGALAAAVGVAKANPVDLDLVRIWSQKENSLEKFEVFLRRLERV
jgi:hypothetical protein